ncbi:MAG TPA: methyltransferase domain-containing protein [Anaeromyxobacteraceae bacterium]|nr:methyltransferase domain-containing protein [Anaeromyxobacteraceae bacterium]
MPRLHPIPRSTLERMGDLVHQRIYTTPNPVVRWIFWSRLARLLQLAEGARLDRVLDCGCGEGALLPSLSAAAREVVAIDVDVRAAERLVRELGLKNVAVRPARIEALPFADGSFDAIFSADVLEHIPVLEPGIVELRRVLAPGGSLFVSAPTENLLYAVGRKVFGFQKPADHYRTARDIEALLAPTLPISAKRYFPVDVAEAISAFVLLRAVRPVSG